MKKILIALLSCLCVLSACNPNMGNMGFVGDITSMQGNSTDSSRLPSASKVVKKYKATKSVEDDKGYEEVVRSVRDENYYYYTIYLGYIENVPLNENVPHYYYSGNAFSKQFTESSTTVESITQQSATTKEKCVENEKLDHKQGSIEVGVEVGKETWPVSAHLDVGFEWGEDNKTAVAVTDMSTTSYQTVEESSKTCTETTEFSFDSSCKIGYYRYIMIGTFDVYATVLAELGEGDEIVKYYVDYETVLCGWGFNLDYSENSKFNDHKYEQLVLDMNDVDKLPPPTRYITEGDGKDDEIQQDGVQRMVYFEKNQGVGGTSYVNIANDGTMSANKLEAPTRDGYLFTGYYSASSVGEGERYFDHNMNLIKNLTEPNNVMYAHWVPASKTSTIVEPGNNVTISNKNVSSTDWHDSTATPVFTADYTYAELLELKAIGCAYMNLAINVGIRIEEECYEWIALRSTKNGVFVGDFHIYRENVDGYGIMYTWTETTLQYAVSIDYFNSPSNGLQIICGISGSGRNEWARGSVVAKFIPSASAVATSSSYP